MKIISKMIIFLMNKIGSKTKSLEFFLLCSDQLPTSASTRPQPNIGQSTYWYQHQRGDGLDMNTMQESSFPGPPNHEQDLALPHHEVVDRRATATCAVLNTQEKQ